MKEITSSIYNFETMRQEGYLYVDKTEYIWKLVHPAGKTYFLSRPRRFGKSLTVSMLKAFFEGKKELFQGLAIYDKPYDWKSYPVIHLDFSNCAVLTPEALETYLMEQLQNIASSFGVSVRGELLSICFENLICDVAAGGKVVILVDEYDKPIMNTLTSQCADDILRVFKEFYSSIMKTSHCHRLTFITGVTKFCHVSLFSDLNNLTDITKNVHFACMLGYTQEELERYFIDRISDLAVNGRSISDCLADIKSWYNGYCFEAGARTVYNPVSLTQFFENGGRFRSYWFSTGTPSFLMDLVKQRNFNFHVELDKAVPEVAFEAFELGALDPLTLLLQTGYFTIKGTEQRLGNTFYVLDFPNREVEEGFNTYILGSCAEMSRAGVAKFVTELVESLLVGDLPRLRATMEIFFAGIPYTVHKKQEVVFQAIFFALFRLLGQYVEAESTTNDGRIDAVVQVENAIYLFEFKLDKDFSGLEQIKRKEYFKKYLLDERRIYIIGVNFDSEKGTLVGWEAEAVH